MKYYIRLENGTNNILLNEAYHSSNKHNELWLQVIHYLLKFNGYGNVMKNTCGQLISWPKQFKKRLDNQYQVSSD